MSQVTVPRAISRVGLLQIAIIVLAVVTALVHLDKGLMTSGFAGHMGGPPSGHFTGRPGSGPGGPGGPPSGFSVMSLLPLPLPVLFYLNFVGYIVLVIALYLPFLRRYQQIIRWVLIGFTAITILAYFLITAGMPNLLGYADKVVEVALIVLLLIEERQTRLARG